MNVQSLLKYDIGDIVFVREFIYPNGKFGQSHLFVIIDDDGQMIPMEYFGLIVSSHIEKSKFNSKYKHNEPLNKNVKNGLSRNSIVRCNDLYRLDKNCIIYKIGSVSAGDFVRFLQSYKNSLLEDKIST